MYAQKKGVYYIQVNCFYILNVTMNIQNIFKIYNSEHAVLSIS